MTPDRRHSHRCHRPGCRADAATSTAGLHYLDCSKHVREQLSAAFGSGHKPARVRRLSREMGEVAA